TNNLETAIASSRVVSMPGSQWLGVQHVARNVVLFNGMPNQDVVPQMEIDLGEGNAPAWRGSTIALLVRYPLKEVGNTIAGLQVRAELGSDIQDPTGIAGIHLQSVTSDPDAFRRACYYMTSTDARVVAYKDDP